MSYTAKSLEEIADDFDRRAVIALADAVKTEWLAHSYRSESSTWRYAAEILRRTTLTEPCHMESDAYTARRNA